MDIINDGPTLVLSGDFDVRSTWEVRHAIYEHLDEDVIIDLSQVATIDVTALRVLAAASVAANQRGHHVTLRGCGPAVRRMMHLSRLIRLLEVERNAATA